MHPVLGHTAANAIHQLIDDVTTDVKRVGSAAASSLFEDAPAHFSAARAARTDHVVDTYEKHGFLPGTFAWVDAMSAPRVAMDLLTALGVSLNGLPTAELQELGRSLPADDSAWRQQWKQQVALRGALGGMVGAPAWPAKSPGRPRYNALLPPLLSSTKSSSFSTARSFEDRVAALLAQVVSAQERDVEQRMKSLESKMKDKAQARQEAIQQEGSKELLKGLGKGALAAAGAGIGILAAPVVDVVVDRVLFADDPAGQAEALEDSVALEMEGLKHELQKLEKMYTCLSNILQVMHQTALHAVRNMRA